MPFKPALTVACPVCTATIGEPCRKLGPNGRTHVRRRQLATTAAGERGRRARPSPRRKPKPVRGRTVSHEVARTMRNRLDDLDLPTYAEYLRTPHWREVRDRWRASEDSLHMCWVCGDPRYVLHHIDYSRLGREDSDDLVPLCERHHKQTHALHLTGLALRKAHYAVLHTFDPSTVDAGLIDQLKRAKLRLAMRGARRSVRPAA